MSGVEIKNDYSAAAELHTDDEKVLADLEAELDQDEDQDAELTPLMVSKLAALPDVPRGKSEAIELKQLQLPVGKRVSAAPIPPEDDDEKKSLSSEMTASVVFDPSLDYSSDDGHSLRYNKILNPNPPDFAEKKHPVRYGLKYRQRIFCVITMYNEGPEELQTTLLGVAKNLDYIIQHTDEKEFWKVFTICIVIDGRTKANPKTLELMQKLGMFNAEMMKKAVDEDMKTKGKVEASVHLFESTIEMKDEKKGKVMPKLQCMLALKEKNAGKLDSHWWYYMAFASVLSPDYCFLLDVGTVPKKQSFYYMFRAMELNGQVAGVAGEITTIDKINLINPIVAAQQFEYKISSIMDKTTESMFGYISVLPGAFSAYRWVALEGEPLKKYFHHLITPLKKQKPFQSNMYLAEDRILCYELVAKAGSNWTLQYVKEAVATTDVPDSLTALIKQRRRWLNGSLFALLYAMFNWNQILQRSTHTTIRKFFLSFQFFYYIIQVLFQWTSVANLYLTFYFMISQLDISAWFIILRYLFFGVLVMQFVLGLGNKPDRMSPVYILSSLAYGCFMLGIFGLSLYQVATGSLGVIVWFSLAATFGVIFLISLVYGSIIEAVFSFVQYIFFSATYVVIFPIYSLCNTHDISWGTKNLDDAKIGAHAEQIIRGDVMSEKMKAKIAHQKKLQEEEKETRDHVQGKFEAFRSYLLTLWILSNGLYVSLMTAGAAVNDDVRTWYLNVIFASVFVLSGIRTFGALSFLFVSTVDTCCRTAPVPSMPFSSRVVHQA